MGCDVGELFELGVGAREIGRPLVELDLHRLADGQLLDDAAAHRLHRHPDLVQLGDSADADRVVEAAGRHAGGVGAQRVERRLDAMTHESEEPGDEHDQHDRDHDQHADEELGGAVEIAACSFALRGQPVLQRGDSPSEVVEARLADGQGGVIARRDRSGGDGVAGRLGIQGPPALAGGPGGVQLAADGETTDQPVERAQRIVPSHLGRRVRLEVDLLPREDVRPHRRLLIDEGTEQPLAGQRRRVETVDELAPGGQQVGDGNGPNHNGGDGDDQGHPQGPPHPAVQARQRRAQRRRLSHSSATSSSWRRPSALTVSSARACSNRSPANPLAVRASSDATRPSIPSRWSPSHPS